jgi:hypothetical protein
MGTKRKFVKRVIASFPIISIPIQCDDQIGKDDRNEDIVIDVSKDDESKERDEEMESVYHENV